VVEAALQNKEAEEVVDAFLEVKQAVAAAPNSLVTPPPLASLVYTHGCHILSCRDGRTVLLSTAHGAEEGWGEMGSQCNNWDIP